MHVGDIMIKEVTAVELGLGIADYAQAILHEDAGSVIMMADDGPAGIVTESNALHVDVAGGRPLSTVPTRTIVSSPIEWVRSDSTTRVAAEKMRGSRVKKLAVADDSEMVGIVAATDIAFRLSDVARGVDQMIELRNKWESDRQFH